MKEVCERHNVLKRSCEICELEEENKQLKEALNKISTRKMSVYLSSRHMNEDFIKIANEALKDS